MRTLLKMCFWLFVAALIAATAAASLLIRRSHHFETMIVRAADAQRIEPVILLGLVQQCSGNNTTFARDEHYGLLALTTADGTAWAAASGKPFDAFDLFDPEKNLQIGAWKFAAALRTWMREPKPELWAVAGWQAPADQVRAWAGAARMDGGDPFQKISDPRVRNFAADVLRKTQREKIEIVLPWRKSG